MVTMTLAESCAPPRRWIVQDDEGYVFVYDAPTRGRARQAHARAYGLSWDEVAGASVRVARGLDGLAPTTWNLIRAGYVCQGELDCGHEFWVCDSDHWDEQTLHVVGDHVYCSAACATLLEGRP